MKPNPFTASEDLALRPTRKCVKGEPILGSYPLPNSDLTPHMYSGFLLEGREYCNLVGMLYTSLPPYVMLRFDSHIAV